MMKKALASDFDNTLFFKNEEGQFRKNDLSAIHAFQKSGGLFGVCTGRSLDGVLNTVQGRVSFDFYILATGAVILDRGMHVLYEKKLSQEDALMLYEAYEKVGPTIFHGIRDVYGFQKREYRQTITSVDEIKEDIVGISIGCQSEEEAESVTQDINRKYGNLVEAFRNIVYIDVVPKGCSKGNALKILKEKTGIDLAAGIGDSFNDMTLLESADVSFTFRDSDPLVKEKADHCVDCLSEAIGML